MDILNFTVIEFQFFILVLIRISAIVVICPVFGSRNVPPQVRIGLALFLSYLVYTTIGRTGFVIPKDLISYGMMAFGELLVGLVIGYVTTLIFAGVQLAGGIIGLQMGFGIVNVIDPLSRTQISLIAEFQFLLATLIFLVINGHHWILKAFVSSFDLVPVLGLSYRGAFMGKMIEMFSRIFVVAIKLGAPAIAVLLLISIAMGIIARTVPQMNIFIVGFPLKIGVGLLILALSLPFFASVFQKLFAQMIADISVLMRYL